MTEQVIVTESIFNMMSKGIKQYIKAITTTEGCIPLRGWTWNFTLCEDRESRVCLKIDLEYDADSRESLIDRFNSLEGARDAHSGVKHLSFREKARVRGVGIAKLGKVIAKMIDIKEGAGMSSTYSSSLYKDILDESNATVILKLYRRYGEAWRIALAEITGEYELDYKIIEGEG